MPRTPDTMHAQLVALAQTNGLPAPPQRPVSGMCCTRGCDPCIWDYYERALSRWRERHALDARAHGGAAASA